MSEPRRDPERLDVAVERLSGSGPGRGRAALVVVAAVLALAVGAAVLGGSQPERVAIVPTVAPLVPSPAVAPSPTPSATGSEMRAEALPALGTDPLAGAPLAVFHRRVGDDLERPTWRPGWAGLRAASPVRGAFAGIPRRTPLVVVGAPGDTAWVVRGLASPGGADNPIRIVSGDGDVLWERDDAGGSPLVPVWSADGRQVVTPGPSGGWRIVRLVPAGTEEVIVPAASLDAAPLPDGGAPVAGASRIPAGFSDDGRWLYVVERRVDGSGGAPVARISTGDGSLAAISAIPTDGPAAAQVEGRLAPERDAVSGRRFATRALAVSTEPSSVRVVEPDGSEAFTVRVDTVLGAAWAGDGRLIVLEADQVPGPDALRLRTVDAQGELGPALLVTGPLTWGTLVGVRDGHALLALAAGGQAGSGMLAMVRLSDGATSSVPLPLTEFATLEVGGWLP